MASAAEEAVPARRLAGDGGGGIRPAGAAAPTLGKEAQDILMYVYSALHAKGYDPITQLVGYIISGDPTYITSYNQARSLIRRLERDEILEELVSYYVNHKLER